MNTVLTKKPNEDLKVENPESLDLKYLQKCVEGCIEIVSFPHKIDMIVNDESLLHDNPVLNFSYSRGCYELPIYGNVVFASYDDEGNTIGLSKDQIDFIKSLF